MKGKIKQLIQSNAMIIAIIILLNIIIALYPIENKATNFYLTCEVEATKADTMQVFYADSTQWKEEQSQSIVYGNSKQKLSFMIPSNTKSIRIDVSTQPNNIVLHNISVKNSWRTIDLLEQITVNEVRTNELEEISKENSQLIIEAEGNDPYFIVDVLNEDIKTLEQVNMYNTYIGKTFICLVIWVVGFIFIKNKNIALSREQILERVWGYDYVGETRTVDIHVQRIREKLNLKDSIKTVFKVGYRFEE